MASLRKSTEERRVELVDAALQHIATRGIASLSTRSLAAQVGLSSGAIFRHFDSLEAILSAVVDRVEAVLEESYPPAHLPAFEKLVRFVEARSDAVGERVGILRLVLSEQFVLALPPGLTARLTAVVRKSRTFLEEAIRDAQKDGSLRDDADAAALTVIVLGTIQAVALLPATQRGAGANRSRVRATLFDLLLPPSRSTAA